MERLVDQLRAGDESAFSELVERMHPQIVRIARRFVQSDATAEDIAQDTWQAVISGIHAFEGRSALSTWILQIAINRAKSRGVRDQRMRPVDDESQFNILDQWRNPPGAWDALPETMVANRELARLVAAAIDELPEQQKAVISLRDVEGIDSREVREILQISEENQRVLLHRARNKVRSAIEAAVQPMANRQSHSSAAPSATTPAGSR